MTTQFGNQKYAMGDININVTGIENTDFNYSNVSHLINAIVTTSPSLVNLTLENLDLNDITNTLYTLKYFSNLSSSKFSLTNFLKNHKDKKDELAKIPKSKDIVESLLLLDDVKSFPNLTTVSFNSTTVSFDFLNQIFKKLGHDLTMLDLSNMTFTENINSKKILDLIDTLVALKNITSHIEILKLNCTNITDPQLFYLFLEGAKDLKELWYRQSNKPDFSTLQNNKLTPLPNLKKIYFSNVYPYNIGGSTVYTIPQTTLHSILNQCVALEELYLSNNDLSSYITSSSTKIPALTISLSTLTHLYLDNTNISANYLIYLLEKTPNVTTLSLNSSNDGNIITDEYIIQIAPAITKLKLTELHFNIIGIPDLDNLIDNIIKPIGSLTILELPFIKDYNYGKMAFRKYKKVILYDNLTIKAIINGTGDYSKLTPKQKMNELDIMSEDNGNIKSQLNELFSENGGDSGSGDSGSSSNKTLVIIAIIIGIILFTLVGGYFIFKFI